MPIVISHDVQTMKFLLRLTKVVDSIVRNRTLG